MKTLLLSAALLLGSTCLVISADDAAQTLYFQKADSKALTTLSIYIEDGKVYGNLNWIPKETDGAHGTLDGTIKGNIIRGVYSFTIEGSEQAEEQIYKLEGDKLIKGEGGEMKETKNGKFLFKDVSKVTFTGDVLKKLTVISPKPGTPERKAIMDAMRGPVSKFAGKEVQFTGDVRMYGGWARFSGKVDAKDGKPPANEDAAAEMELDFTAFLQKTEAGTWKTMHWGFAGDISVIEDAREKCADAPWVMFD